MKLYFEDTGGNKPCLVLIAGLASDSVSWVFQKAPFTQAFRLITFDNRGVGRSPIPEGPYSIEQMADDALTLLDSLGVEKAHLLGHSMGGLIVQQIARKRPELVDKMVLACSFSHSGGRALPVLESWVDVLRREGTATELARVLFPWLYSPQFFLTEGAFEASVQALAAHPYQLTAQGVGAQVEAIKGFDSREWLGELKQPTMVLTAEHDLIVPKEESRDFASRFSQGSLRQISSTGHSCMLENPEGFNEAVLDFLEE